MKADRVLCNVVLSIVSLAGCLIKTRNCPRSLKCFISGFFNKKNDFNPYEEIFFYEGQATRQAAISGVLRNKYDPDLYLSDEIPNSVKYIGYGLWNGICKRKKINFLLKKKISPKEKSLLADGEFFAKTLMSPDSLIQSSISNLKIRSPLNISQAMGIGRALTWLDPEDKKYQIKNSQAFEVLLVGKFIAHCLTSLGDPDLINKRVEKIAKSYPEQSKLIQDISFEISSCPNKLYKYYEDLHANLFKIGKYSS